MSPLLKVAGVSKSFGALKANRNICFEVARGEALAILGENGAGKTTLMRVISGMTEPFSGEMEMEGKSLSSFPPHQIVELGIAHVPENRRLFPGMSVEDNLKLGAFAKTARSDSAKNLEFVYELFPRMKERRSQLAGTMSGGEQQMCAIGRAIMSGPKLLLMDEPSAGLAPVVVQQVFSLVRRIREEGYTVLIVEQNVQQVLQVVDRAYLLEAGQLIDSGKSKDLLESDSVRKAYMGL